MPNPPSSRRDRRLQLLVLLALALLGTVPFWVSDLDTAAAAHFYRPGAEEPWPGARDGLWMFLYQAAPLLVGAIMLGGLGVLAAGTLWPRFARLRIYAVLLVAAAAIGPGLIVNTLLKDHWGRPRPHQTLALGGSEAYLPPLVPGESGTGKSFPCGHSSAGFLLAAFYPIWRRRRPRLALGALAGATLLGTVLGVGRMAAGDHFLSDVIWSAVIAYGVVFVLYYHVLRIPDREDAAALRPPPAPRPLRRPLAAAMGYGVAATAIVAGVLAATPVHESRTRTVRLGEPGDRPHTLRLVADQAQVLLAWQDSTDRAALILLKGRGFGLPGTRVLDSFDTENGVATFRVAHRGVFTEKDTSLTALLTSGAWSRVEVQTESGDIRVYPVPAQAPELKLDTGDGQVLHDAPR